MLQAKVVAVMIQIHCPACEQPIADIQSGSVYWNTEEVSQGLDLFCVPCAREVRVAPFRRVAVTRFEEAPCAG